MEEPNMILDSFVSMWWITLAAVLSPLLALVVRRVVPDTVWLLGFGVLIGPHALGLAEQTEAIEFIRELGMGFLFLLAGFEIKTSDMRGKQGRHAALTWIICALLGVGAGYLLTQGEWKVAVVLGIASTSTALGTLLPILKDSGVLPTALGRGVMLHGAYGELLPIVAMALLLSTHGTWQAALLLIAFAVIAAVTVFIPARFFRRIPLLGRAFASASNSTMQTTMRISVLILVSLMLLTAALELDVALGAFSAGILINTSVRALDVDLAAEIMHKIEIVGFSLLIPVFFVTTGMAISLQAVVEQWPLLLGFVAMITMFRGMPVFLREMWTNTQSGLTSVREKAALGLYSATGLPIIVAVTQVAVSSELIDSEIASVMVTGGAITVLLFPLFAQGLTRQQTVKEESQ